MTDSGAQRAYNFLKNGIVKGLSIGYQVDPSKVTYGTDGTRTIREVKLFEISLVAVPCAPTARVVSVKSLSQVERLLAGIKPGDVTGDAAMAAQLRGIDSALKGLLRKDSSCNCHCLECPAGDCADCPDSECIDPNCEGSVKARQNDQDLKLLKAFAMELKAITG